MNKLFPKGLSPLGTLPAQTSLRALVPGLQLCGTSLSSFPARLSNSSVLTQGKSIHHCRGPDKAVGKGQTLNDYGSALGRTRAYYQELSPKYWSGRTTSSTSTSILNYTLGLQVLRGNTYSHRSLKSLRCLMGWQFPGVSHLSRSSVLDSWSWLWPNSISWLPGSLSKSPWWMNNEFARRVIRTILIRWHFSGWNQRKPLIFPIWPRYSVLLENSESHKTIEIHSLCHRKYM